MLAMPEVMETALNFEKKIYRNFYLKKWKEMLQLFHKVLCVRQLHFESIKEDLFIE